MDVQGGEVVKERRSHLCLSPTFSIPIFKMERLGKTVDDVGTRIPASPILKRSTPNAVMWEELREEFDSERPRRRGERHALFSLAPSGQSAQRKPAQQPPSRASSSCLGSFRQTRPEPQRVQQPSTSAIPQMPSDSLSPEPAETRPGRHLLSDHLQPEVTDQPRPVEPQAFTWH